MIRNDGVFDESLPMGEDCVRTQEEMCEHFIPILQERGQIVNKCGRRMARQAVKGEEVLTIVNGEVLVRTRVEDETSMVIRQESADHEFYVLTRDKFVQNYQTEGKDVHDSEPHFFDLRARGFKYYDRKGKLLIYEVTEDDMSFVPGKRFRVSFSATPMPLRAGDYLVTGYPEATEVWMSRNLSIYNDNGQLFAAHGVCTQETLCNHFLPIFKEKGIALRRVGQRLARPAKKGEEVLTIINNEVVAKRIVGDDPTWVIQEESADREIYALDGEIFLACYEMPGVDITAQGGEFDVLRERGFKYFTKSGGTVQLYRVTEEDMTHVPGGMFQVPFSSIPQPLKAGDYLVTSYPGHTPLYMSRNAEQTFHSDNLVVHYAFASPVTGTALSINAELEGLRTSGAALRITCATRENLVLLKGAWASNTACVLHLSCHTSLREDTPEMVLEDANGGCNPVSGRCLVDLVIGGGTDVTESFKSAPQVVVLNSCHSEAIAKLCLDRGVQRAVAVRDNATLLDRAARDFTFSFYGELRACRSVETAFDVAIKSMEASEDEEVRRESAKLVLLPQGSAGFYLHSSGQLCACDDELEPHIAVRFPFGTGETGRVGPLMPPHSMPPLEYPLSPSFAEFITRALNCFSRGFRVIKVHGSRGAGKRVFANMLASFAAFPGGRLFCGGAAVIYNSASEAAVPTQQQMCQHFIPIMLKRGTKVPKVGRRLARRAKKGDEVLTIVNGEVVAKTVAMDSTSMVIQQDTMDKELYVLDREKFAMNYELPGQEISEQGPDWDEMRKRGYKYYNRQGTVLIYQVNEDDMEFIPSGKFEVTFSPMPQPIQVGDFLVTGFPECSEVYMSRNAKQIYPLHAVRTQAEMQRHFLPIIRRCGTVMRDVRKYFARPARQGEEVDVIIDGEAVDSVVVKNRTSMVILAESVENERYVMNEQEFHRTFDTGEELEGQGDEVEVLRERGFRAHAMRAWARVYCMTEEDMNFVAERRFWSPWGDWSFPLRPGDHLLATYPAGCEVWMRRNLKNLVTVTLSEVVRSREEMSEHFLPKLHESGVCMQRQGRRLARPARPGELIRTIVDGEEVSRWQVRDNSSMVVREESSDRELYVFSSIAFARRFRGPPEGIDDAGPEADALRQRGYKYYQQSGEVLVYKVSEEDMRFVPSGYFEVSFSDTPQRLQAGDYLVAHVDPSLEEVFLNRNSPQVYAELTAHEGRSAALGDCRRATFVERTRSRISEAPDHALRARTELEDALRMAAGKQATLVTRWYGGHKAPKPRNPEPTDAESAVAAWMEAVPEGSRALLVLVKAAQYLAYEASRELLRNLLRKHRGLHILAILEDGDEGEGCLLGSGVIKELDKVVELPSLTKGEAAMLFYEAAMRRRALVPVGQKLAQLGDHATKVLEHHAVIERCDGKPGNVLQLVEQLDENVLNLDML